MNPLPAPRSREVRLKNDLAEISRLSAEIREFLEPHAVSKMDVNALNLALEELVTNIICYAFGDGAEHVIEVDLERAGDDVIVTVRDDGPEFDPLQCARPDIDTPVEQRPVGGLGILLVQELMDQVSYARRDGRNILRLRKRAGGDVAPAESGRPGLPRP